MSMPAFTSIIVPAYNNGDIVEKSLLSLVSQEYPAKEIVVVYDEGSTDSTKEILSKIQNQFSQLIRVISTKHVGRSQARNMGARSASGEILFFADADDIYNKDYLDKAVASLASDPGFGGVTLTGASLKVESTFATNCLDVYSSIVRKLADTGKVKPKWAWVYRRQAFEAVGGFDERLNQAEDKDLYLRTEKAGYSFGFVKGVNWWHTRRGTFSSYLRKSFLAGKRRTLYIIKHGEIRDFFKNAASFWLFCILLFLSPLIIWLFYLTCFAVAALMIYNLANTLILGWDVAPKKLYLFLYPTFNLLTYIATALGYTRGFSLVIKEKITRKPINWPSI